MEKRYCIIGAGYSGLAAAKAFADLGLAYDHLEATDAIGGNWSHGVYDSTHLISSKSVTQYADHPMPADWPDFPSAAQMLAYLRDFARTYRLDERIEFDTAVTLLEPLDATGRSGWQVELATGEVRKYTGVVVANGHYWDPYVPAYPGTFTGTQLHSKQYRRPGDFVGTRVLVVGAGNSGCDLAVEAAQAFGAADLSVRRGYWLLPKYVAGIPLGEFDRGSFPLPRVLEAALLRALAGIGTGSARRHGLPRPTHGILEQDIVVNQQLPYFLKHGRVRPRPEISRFDGTSVHFVDGSHGDYDTILWATGFRTSFPFIPDGLLSWQNGQPRLLGHMLPVGLANLYLYGLVAPRAGAGTLLTNSARLLAEAVCVQEALPVPLADVAGAVLRPRASILAGGPGLRWEIARALPVIRALHALTSLSSLRRSTR